MRLYDISFFCDNGICVSANSKENNRWPVVLNINESGRSFDTPSIVFYLGSQRAFMHFKNSVIAEYERLYGK